MPVLGRLSKLIKEHPSYAVALCALVFIVLVLGASLYANEQVWNFLTGPGGIAQGRGGPQPVIQTLVQYDSVWYTHIAQDGYTTAMSTNFFPLYPLVIRGLSYVFQIPVTYAAIVASWAALCAGAVVFYKWVKFELENGGYKISPWLPVGLVAVFPTANYLVLPYTESLFLVLNVSALLLFRKKQYVLAGIVAAAASATHEQGILLSLFFVADYWFSKDRDFKKLIPAALGALGIAAYMVFLWVHFGNPLQFLDAARNWGRLTPNIFANLIATLRPEYLWFVGVGVAGLWAVKKYLSSAYFIYCLVFFMLPIVSGNLTSINRYLLSLLPMFLGLAIFAQKKVPIPVQYMYVAISALLLGWSILLYANGYWVA